MLAITIIIITLAIIIIVINIVICLVLSKVTFAWISSSPALLEIALSYIFSLPYLLTPSYQLLMSSLDSFSL